ncbi:MAG: dUTP diphosphatase [Patescibacteria group bacterium]|jgi:dUTP pyrophosphatase
MKVNIKRVDSTLPLPEHHTSGAVAFDFVARESVTIAPQSVGLIPGNVIIKVPAGYMLFIKERSSTALRKGVFCTAGIIDQDYCGENDEIKIQVINFKNEPVTIERADRIAQGIFVKIEKAEWNEVDKMIDKDRGGFGTTN